MKDCKQSITYFEEKNEMTKHCKIPCSICQLYVYNNGTCVSCYEFQQQFPDKAIELVQKWSDENVIPTLRHKLLEVFPDADMDSLCVEYIGFSNVMNTVQVIVKVAGTSLIKETPSETVKETYEQIKPKSEVK